MPNRIRIGIIDEQPLFRLGVASAFAAHPEFEICGGGNSYDDAIRLSSTASLAILFMDINIRGGGIAAVRAIEKLDRSIRVLFLTTSERQDDVSAALEAGVSGYILKGIGPDDLVSTVRTILAGETFITPLLASRLLIAAARAPSPTIVAQNPLQQLTAREQQILKHVSQGRTNKETANVLSISEKTVKHYMSSILQKLSVRNRTEAVLMMLETPKEGSALQRVQP